MATATGSDVPATSARDTLTGVAARSVPVTRAHPLSLPTPPNSISPALPPHGLTAQLHKAGRLDPIDSDLDLQDADADTGRLRLSSPSGRTDGGSDVHNVRGDHDSLRVSGVAALLAASAITRGDSPPYESIDAITPAMLAKYHLPEILLNHGPLAFRYIIGHLTASVPGFSTIPPAKSRRLVVAALEGRGGGGGGGGNGGGGDGGLGGLGGGGLGGLEGDVEFEKVSWGVWGARKAGGGVQPRQKLPTPPPHLGIPISSGSRLRLRGKDRGAFSSDDPHEDVSMLDDDMDNMSMDGEADEADDGSASASCSEAPDDDIAMNDDPDNLTDDEDWGAVGAAALRAASYSHSATAGRFSSSGVLSPFASYTNFSATMSTASDKRRTFYNAAADGAARSQRLSAALNSPTAAAPEASDEQEREAIEALLRLGSV